MKTPRKISVKIIKGQAYLYTWNYKKKINRFGPPNTNRYNWKYQGKYGSKLSQKLLRNLTEEEKIDLKFTVEKKLHNYNLLEKEKKKLLTKEPFLTKYKEIMEINNRLKREKLLLELNSELLKLIKKSSRS